MSAPRDPTVPPVPDRPDPKRPTRTIDHVPGGTMPGPDRTTDLTSDSHDQGEAERGSPSVSVPGYEIEAVLGRGGMGVVYKAQHQALKRTVALKMVLAGGHAGPRDLARFRIEAEAVARLQHPNIVQIHEVGEAGGHPYFALEFVGGGDLAGRIGGKPLPPREAAKVVEALARAMQLAHSRNVVHRDLKPANVLLTADGTPKITDFGLARQMDGDSGETQAGAVMGTPSYMAPEQASGQTHEAGPAADVYALGAILYECLTGRPPFQGKTIVATLDQVRTQEPVPPSRRRKGVPPDLETICLKCLRKEPENRYGSAAELADDLVRYQQGEPILARPVGSVERVAKWCRRRPAMAASLGLLTAVVVSAVAAVTWQWREARALAAAEARQREAAETAQGREKEQRETAEKARQSEATQRKNAERAQDEAERALYYSRVTLAHVEYERGNIVRMAELLDACPPKRIGWEWHALQRLMRQDQVTLPCGGWQSAFAVWSPDKRYLATSSTDRRGVQLWDAGTFQPVKRFEARIHVVGAAFSPDGKRVATAANIDANKPAEPGRVFVWDVETGRQIHEFRDHTASVACVAFSPDGSLLASGSGHVDGWGRHPGELVVREAATGKTLWTATEAKGCSGVLFHPEGKELIDWGGGSLRLRSVATGEAVLRENKLPSQRVVAAGISRDGTRLAVGDPNCIHLLNWESGSSVSCSWKSSLKCVAFGRTGSHYYSASKDEIVRMWDPATGQVLSSLRGHGHWLNHCEVDPDGKRLASASVDGLVKVWDLSAATDGSFPLRHVGTPERIACSSDNRWVASAGAGTVRLWDRATWKPAHDLTCPTQQVPAMAFSGNGRLLAVGGDDGRVRLWLADSGKEVLTHKAHENGVTDVCLDREATLLVTGGKDGLTKVWRLPGPGQPTQLLAWQEPNGAFPSSVAISNSGEDLMTLTTAGKQGGPTPVRVWSVTTGRQIEGNQFYRPERAVFGGRPEKERLAVVIPDDGNLRVWDRLPSGGWDLTRPPQLQLSGHSNGCRSIAFSPDGSRIVTGDHEGTLRVWDASSGEAALTLRVPEVGPGATLAFTGDSRALVVCGYGNIRVWDVQPTLMPYARELSGVWHLAVSPDGSTLAVASKYGTVLREAATGKLLRTLTGAKGEVRRVAWSPDGKTVASTSYDGNLRTWDAASGRPLRTLSGASLSLAFSPDGKRLLGGGWAALHVFDAATGTPLRKEAGPAQEVWYASYNRDGSRIVAVGPDGKLRVWNADTLALTETLDGHSAGVQMAVFHPRQELLATCGNDGQIILWDIATWKPVKKMDVGGELLAVAFSRDGKRMACGDSTGGVRVWDVETWQPVPLGRSPHVGRVDGVAFSHDGRELFTADEKGLVRRWPLPPVGK